MWIRGAMACPVRGGAVPVPRPAPPRPAPLCPSPRAISCWDNADSPVGKRDWRVLLHFLEMAERGEVDVGRPLADAELAAEGIGKLGRDALRAEVRCSLLAGVLHCMLAQLIHFLCD